MRNIVRFQLLKCEICHSSTYVTINGIFLGFGPFVGQNKQCECHHGILKTN